MAAAEERLQSVHSQTGRTPADVHLDHRRRSNGHLYDDGRDEDKSVAKRGESGLKRCVLGPVINAYVFRKGNERQRENVGLDWHANDLGYWNGTGFMLRTFPLAFRTRTKVEFI